jgi:PAS domain S-box-containing protein
LVDPTQAPHLKPYVAPGAERGIPWGWISAITWIALAAMCVHLILSVTAKQSELKRQINWWREARPYHEELNRLSEVSSDATYRFKRAQLLSDLSPTLRSELREHRLLYSIPVASVTTSEPAQRWTTAEAELAEALATLEEDEGLTAELLTIPATRLAGAVAAAMRDVTSGMTAQTQALDADRRWLYVVAGLSVLGAGAMVLLLMRNHRKRMALAASQAALQVSEARYRNMFQENRTVQLVVHPGTRRIVDGNRAALAFYGLDFEELTSKRLHDLVARDDPIRPEDQRQDEAGRPLLARHVVADGSTRDVEVRASPFEGHGRQLHYLIIQDVTERHQAERALRESEERLRATVSSMSDGVLSVDAFGEITFANQAAAEITGWPLDAIVGERLTKIYNVRGERDGSDQRARLEQLPTGAAGTGRPMSLRLIQRMEGERTVAEASATLRDAHGEAVGSVLVIRDVTEQRKLEEEILRGQKLDSLGVLAGGIAHDFNNILAGVFGHLSIARSQLDDQEALAARIGRAEAACARARDLTQRLLTFARGGTPIRKSASLGELITESVDFALRGSNVASEVRISDDLWTAPVDRGQISQVLHNLVINADQAMPEGGALTVVAENAVITEESSLTLEPGQYVHISVTDTGVGIEPEVMARIFDPYFTTKEMGTGLGLASSFSIVRGHEGAVTVESTLASGTTFHVYLPCVDTAIEAEEPTRPALSAPRGGGRILVMDDDPELREVLSGQLTQLGYFVETTADGHGAVDRYTDAFRRDEPFDLVILDLTVPGGVGGLETIDSLLALDPSARAVLCTGYANHMAMAQPERFGFCGTLPKPFTRGELRSLLASVLDSGQAPDHAAP